MKKITLLFFLLIAVTMMATGQKKALSHSDYDIWQSFGSASISDNGKWVTYEINPQEGDGWLYFYNVAASKLDSVFCGYKAEFAPGADYIAFMVKPTFLEARDAKKKKLKDDKAPKDNLGIRISSTGETKIVEKVKSFSLSESNSPWMAYLLEKKEAKKPEKEAEKEEVKSDYDQQMPRPAAGRGNGPVGSELVIINPVSGKEHRFNDVTEYYVSKKGGSIGFLQVTADSLKVETHKLSVFNTGNESVMQVFEGKGSVKRVTSDEQGVKYSFLYSSDTAKIKVYSLFFWSGKDAPMKVAESGSSVIPKDWSPSENGSISFSDDGSKLFFTTSVTAVKEPEDTLLADEKYSLDIWSWDDPLLQPMQKKQLASENRKSFMAVYHIKSGKVVQIGSEDVPSVRSIDKGNSNIAIGVSNLKYRKESSWNSNGGTDYYTIDLITGAKKMLLEGISSQPSVSPKGKYILYWSNDEKAWFSIPIAGGAAKNVTSAINVPLYNEEHDTPDDPRPHGVAGWIDGDRYFLLNDRYDIWLVDATAVEKPVNLTSSLGRENNIRYRYNDFSSAGGRFGRGSGDNEPISRKEPIYLTSFNFDSKEAGFSRITPDKAGKPEKLISGKFATRFSAKAKDSDVILWSMETVDQSPNLYITDKNFKSSKVISVTNPQQTAYNWSTVELVEWDSFHGETLQGLLYKPENFDPSKKYPMVVYFYERSSDGLYSYQTPAPSASTINKILAVSNGYLIFVPDIPYREGYPGESCYNAVVSGTYALLERFPWIDKSRLGLDGQSWGGYQIAWLVTKTDLFACAFSGAPVVNMTSAYGGIRWGTGMSRMFQYEGTQSRIGGTLWERPFHYIENSPIFYVPKINTPLLIMANDEDGAVPWYQGIEFITALRRLEKPAWLLVYNGEDHNLTKRPNRKDLSIRKMQFFDHYLQAAPMPSWMKNGIPQTEKGKTGGYELVK